MKSHEIEVKNSKGHQSIVSVEHYLANKTALTPTMDAKDVDAYCKKHTDAKAKAKKELADKAAKETEEK